MMMMLMMMMMKSLRRIIQSLNALTMMKRLKILSNSVKHLVFDCRKCESRGYQGPTRKEKFVYFCFFNLFMH